MDNINQPLSQTILGMNYLGDIVFAVTGALTAGRNKMDIIGYVMIGTITGIGGGTLRDVILGRKVWWTDNPEELLICVIASLIAFFFIKSTNNQNRSIVWLDAIGLAAFAVVGAHIGMLYGTYFIVAVFMGMLTATGGGVIRDVLTNTKPMILSAGELYGGCPEFCVNGHLAGNCRIDRRHHEQQETRCTRSITDILTGELPEA